MDNRVNLENAAYTKEYSKHRRQIIEAVFLPKYIMEKEERSENEYRRIITEYGAELEGKRLYCSQNEVYNEAGTLVHSYINLYHHPFFCTLVDHEDGRRYLIYKQDLYGYSVFDIEAKTTFDYLPAQSFRGGETFIATDIYYNPQNSIAAVEGCYWACPVDTFLFLAENPMERFSKYLNLHLLLDAEYDIYDDICFAGWEGTSIYLKCSGGTSELEKDEIIVVSQEEYMPKMVNTQ